MKPNRPITALAILALAVTIATTNAAAQRQTVNRQPSGSPATFLAHIVRLLAANRYAEAWPALNPRQQAIVPLDVYTACESQTPIPGRLSSLRVLAVSRQPASVLPDRPPVGSTAVKFALRITGSPVPSGVSIVLTAHAIAAGSRWTWIMPPARLRLYAQGCGSPTTTGAATSPPAQGPESAPPGSE